MNLFWKGFSEKLFSEEMGSTVAELSVVVIVVLVSAAVVISLVVAIIEYNVRKSEEA